MALLAQSVVQDLLTRNLDLVLLAVILVVGGLVAYLVARSAYRLLVAAGVADVVEGTASERAAQRLGTSTVAMLSWLLGLFVFVLAAVLALGVAALFDIQSYLIDFIDFLPDLFIATLIVIVGLILADRAELRVAERLGNYKFTSTGALGLVPGVVKYSVIYIAALVALGQIGVADDALIVLLAAYVFGVVFLGGLAGKDLLAAGAAGTYLLLNQPYAIGDEVRVDDMHGVVQEVDVFVTHVENDGEEFIIPNHRIFRTGVVRVR
ncbi:mechanosensitive ion channel domain-containing protein [Halococcus sp. PRR34]|uniref:mechanosensitive ion channel domain-containing protein n=1 Tax=Halococcus TaxID=2249 RepID=UPI002361A178|nr:mechanosensitive ion channel domain-containing protein [Halococcus sp. PRR34]